MNNRSDNEIFQSYVPVYDVAPEKWEEGRAFVVEQFKRMANAINVREIGFYIDEEVLSGKALYPGQNERVDGGSSQQFRTILRKVIIFGAITAGTNSQLHGINNDANFTLIQLWASATNSTTFRSVTFGDWDSVYIQGNTVYVISDGTYDRCNVFIEYTQEL